MASSLQKVQAGHKSRTSIQQEEDLKDSKGVEDTGGVSFHGVHSPGPLELEHVEPQDIEETELADVGLIAAAAVGVAAVLYGGQLLWRTVFGGRNGYRESKPNKALVWKAKRQASLQHKPLRLVVSENFKLSEEAANQTHEGWSNKLRNVKTTAKIVSLLSDKGVDCMGKVMMDVDFCDVIEEGRVMFRNPSVPGHVCGGPCTGAAVAVASGLADVALATDSVGGVRIPAACCGVVGFRSTKGLIPVDGISTGSHSLDVAGAFVKDLTLLPKLGDLLNLPGKKDWKGEVVNIKIAKDLFQSWLIKDNREMYASLTSACLSWAGDGCVEEVDVSEFLAKNTIGWEEFSEGSLNVFEAYRGVATCINTIEARRKMEVVDETNIHYQEDDMLYQKALEVKAGIQKRFKAGIAGQDIVIFPALRKPPVSRTATPTQVTTFFRESQQMCALATLVECPQINFPIRNRQGELFSIGMVSMNKSDRQFLATAGKLIELVGEEMSKILEVSPTEAPLVVGRDKKPETSNARQYQRQEAESCKERGNKLFREEKFADAVGAYSEAIGLVPDNATYYNNRAMALIKLMQFHEAENDCNKALALDGVNAKALLRRGVAKKALNRLKDAKTDFERVLSIEPKNRQALQELDDIHQFYKSQNALIQGVSS